MLYWGAPGLTGDPLLSLAFPRTMKLRTQRAHPPDWAGMTHRSMQNIQLSKSAPLVPLASGTLSHAVFPTETCGRYQTCDMTNDNFTCHAL